MMEVLTQRNWEIVFVLFCQRGDLPVLPPEFTRLVTEEFSENFLLLIIAHKELIKNPKSDCGNLYASELV